MTDRCLHISLNVVESRLQQWSSTCASLLVRIIRLRGSPNSPLETTKIFLFHRNSSYMVFLFLGWPISDSNYSGCNLSSPRYLEHSVPQGSLLGSQLFTLFMAHLQDVIRSHSLDSMFYANDTQIYIVIDDPTHSVDSVGVLQASISEVFMWDTKNMLKCNPGKTEILRFKSPFNKQPTVYETLMLANTSTEVKIKAKNLGVIMDKTLSFVEHINEMCKKASYAIRSTGRLWKYLPFDGLKMLVSSHVISRLDYCNSLLYDIPKYQRYKLQRIQNTAVRMIAGACSSDNITLILKREPALAPSERKVNFKILLITYKILNGQPAGYLEPLIMEYHSLPP